MLPGDKTLLTSALMGSQMVHLPRDKLWQTLMPGYRSTGVSISGMYAQLEVHKQMYSQ